MLPDKSTMCHRTGFTKTCFKCVTEHNCQLWIHTLGRDPQTDKEIDSFLCIDILMPKLLIENSKLTLEAGAATESFRNEYVKRADELNNNLKDNLEMQIKLQTNPNVRYLTSK